MKAQKTAIRQMPCHDKTRSQKCDQSSDDEVGDDNETLTPTSIRGDDGVEAAAATAVEEAGDAETGDEETFVAVGFNKEESFKLPQEGRVKAEELEVAAEYVQEAGDDNEDDEADDDEEEVAKINVLLKIFSS